MAEQYSNLEAAASLDSGRSSDSGPEDGYDMNA